MIHRHKRLSQRFRQRFSVRDAHQQRSDKPRPLRHADRIHVTKLHPRPRQRFSHDRNDLPQMFARGQLRHHAAIFSGEYRSAKPQRWTKSRDRRRQPLPRSRRTKIQCPECASSWDSHGLKLQLQILQVLAKGSAQLFVLQRNLHRRFQKSQFVAGIVGNAFVDIRPEAVFVRQQAQRVGQLNFISRARLGALQAIENLWRQNVSPSDRQV